MKQLSTLKNSFFTALGLSIISFSSFAQLGGFYTIGGAPGPLNFTTFAAAVTSLNAVGVAAGGATFNVASGAVFNETPLTLSISVNPPNITNQLAFQNAGLTPTINFLGTSSNLDGGFKLVGMDFVTFNGLKINDLGTSNLDYLDIGFFLVRASATNGSQNITIRNCTVDLSRANYTAVPGASAIYAPALDFNNVACQPSSVTGRNQNISVFNNLFTDLNRGMWFSSSNVVGLYDDNIQIGVSGSNTVIIGGLGTALNLSSLVGIQLSNGSNTNIQNNFVYTGIGNRKGGYGITSNSAFSGTVTISSNTVSFQADSAMSTVGATGIRWGGSGSMSEIVNITDNVVENCTLGFPGYNSITIFKGISAACEYGLLNLTGNIIRNNINYSISFSGPGIPGPCLNNLWIQQSHASIQLENQSGVLVNNVQNIMNNTINNNGSRSWYSGILNRGNNSNVISNHIHDNYLFSTGGASDKFLTGIFLQAGVTTTSYVATVNNNLIYNLTSDASGATVVSGIRRHYEVGGLVTITNNTISGLSSANSTVAGIYHNGAQSCSPSNSTTIGTTISRNVIYDLTTNGANSAAYGILTIWGTIYGGGSFDFNVHNNFISNIKAPFTNQNPGVTGIHIGTNVTAQLYFNSILLQASSSSASFGSAGIYVNNTGTFTTVDSRNNLIVNQSTAGATGQTVAFRLAGTNLTYYGNLSNYNSYYAGTPSAQNLIFTDGANSFQTISTYSNFIGNGRDVNALSANPIFPGAPNDLHTNDISVAAMGIFMAGYPTDIDFQPRNTPPAVGADEPPPIILPISITSFEGNCESGKNNLKWTTASEKEARDFTIEKSTDMEYFMPVAKIKAKNLKSDENVYTFVDEEETNKEVYYRLVQDSKILGLLNANCKIKEIVDFTIYPNPAGTSETINVNLTSGELNQVSVQIFDCRGVKLYDKEIHNEDAKSRNIQLNHSFAPGIYVVSVISSTENFRKKLVVQ